MKLKFFTALCFALAGSLVVTELLSQSSVVSGPASSGVAGQGASLTVLTQALSGVYITKTGDSGVGTVGFSQGYGGTFILGTNVGMGVDGFGDAWRFFAGVNGFKIFSSDLQLLYTIGESTANDFDVLFHNDNRANKLAVNGADSVSVGASHSIYTDDGGGSGSANYEVDVPSGAMWMNQVNPRFGINSTGNDETATNSRASLWTNLLSQIGTNGQLAAWVAAGMTRSNGRSGVLFAMEGGWQFTNRVGGLIVPDPLRYPNITNLGIHLNSSNVGLGCYNYFYPARPSAMGNINDTVLLQGMFNTSRTWFHPSGTSFDGGSVGDTYPQPVITPETVKEDIAAFYSYRFDDYAFQNGTTYTDIYGYTFQALRKLTHHILYPSLGYRPDHIGLRPMTLNVFGDFQFDGAMHMMNSRSVNAFGLTNANQPYPLFAANGLSWAMGAVRANMTEMKRWPDNGPFIRFNMNGDSGDWDTNAYRGALTIASLYFMETLFCYHMNGSNLPSACIQPSTNALMLKIHQNRQLDSYDGFRRWPIISTDNGSNSVHVRWLSPTKRAVAFVNENTNAVLNQTVTWAQLGVAANSTLAFTNVWDTTSFISSTNLLTHTTAAGQAGYYYIDILSQPEQITARSSADGNNNALIVEKADFGVLFAFDGNPAASLLATMWGPTATRTSSNYRMMIDETGTPRWIVNTPPGGTFIGTVDNANPFFVISPTNAAFISSMSTSRSNLLAPATIAVGASPFNWTNTQVFNVHLFVGNGTALTYALNGTALASAVAAGGLATMPLQPGERVTITYTVAPTMFWKPY